MQRLISIFALAFAGILFLGSSTASAAPAGTYTGTATVEHLGPGGVVTSSYSVPATATVTANGAMLTNVVFASATFNVDTSARGWAKMAPWANYLFARLMFANPVNHLEGATMRANTALRLTTGPGIIPGTERASIQMSGGTAAGAGFRITFTGLK